MKGDDLLKVYTYSKNWYNSLHVQR